MEIKRKHISISWSAPEHYHIEKGSGWYLIIGGVSLLLLTIALFTKNFFFAVFILIASALIMIFGSQEPRIYEFQVDERGVMINNKLHGYNEFVSYSIRKHNHEPREIVMHLKKKVNPFIHLPMEPRTIPDVHAILAGKLKETEFEESFADILADIIGF